MVGARRLADAECGGEVADAHRAGARGRHGVQEADSGRVGQHSEPLGGAGPGSPRPEAWGTRGPAGRVVLGRRCSIVATVDCSSRVGARRPGRREAAPSRAAPTGDPRSRSGAVPRPVAGCWRRAGVEIRYGAPGRGRRARRSRPAGGRGLAGPFSVPGRSRDCVRGRIDASQSRPEPAGRRREPSPRRGRARRPDPVRHPDLTASRGRGAVRRQARRRPRLGPDAPSWRASAAARNRSAGWAARPSRRSAAATTTLDRRAEHGERTVHGVRTSRLSPAAMGVHARSMHEVVVVTAPARPVRSPRSTSTSTASSPRPSPSRPRSTQVPLLRLRHPDGANLLASPRATCTGGHEVLRSRAVFLTMTGYEPVRSVVGQIAGTTRPPPASSRRCPDRGRAGSGRSTSCPDGGCGSDRSTSTRHHRCAPARRPSDVIRIGLTDSYDVPWRAYRLRVDLSRRKSAWRCAHSIMAVIHRGIVWARSPRSREPRRPASHEVVGPRRRVLSEFRSVRGPARDRGTDGGVAGGGTLTLPARCR